MSTQGVYNQRVSPKSRLVALLLCLFVGYLGVHQFYVNKICLGILYLCTGGIFGIGIFVDLILILVGSFKDDRGLPLTEWEEMSARTPPPAPRAPARPAPPAPPRPAPRPPTPPTQQTMVREPTKKAKYCQICGSANELDSTYCSSCGSVIE